MTRPIDDLLLELIPEGPLAPGNEEEFREAVELIRCSIYFATKATDIVNLFVAQDPKFISEFQYVLTLAYLAGRSQGHASAFQELMEGR